MQAYVLVQTATPDQSFKDRLSSVPGVISAEDVTGAYDAVVLAAARSMRQLTETVISTILAIPGITRALPAPMIRTIADRPRSASSNEDEGSSDQAA